VTRSTAFCGWLALSSLALLPGMVSAAPTLPAPDPGLLSALPLPTVQVTLSRPVYRIRIDRRTGAPVMPRDVIATAAVRNWPAGVPLPTTFLWRVYLDWDSKVFPTHHSIRNKLFTQPSPLKVNFGEEIRGGTLTVFAKTLLNGKEVWGKARALVLGENPPRNIVLQAFPRSRFGLIASKIGMAESGLRQFTEPGGMPVLSRTNDIGMMQLNAPTGAITSADQVWDWRANAQRGLEMLRGKHRSVFLASRHSDGLQRVAEDCCDQIAFLNCARTLLGLPCLSMPSVPPLSDKPGSGKMPGEPDPDHLNLSQWEREAVRRYNGGREYAFVIAPDPNTLGILSAGWQVDPTRGGIRPTSGDPDYVTHVLRARSGLVLTVPSKHKPTKRSRSHHRRHHRR